MTEPAADWLSALQPDETLLWQGRPDGRLMYLWRHTVETVMGLAFASGAVLCLFMLILLLPQLVAFAVLPGVVVFSGVAFFLGIWPHWRDARRRRRTRYALTTRRAVIAEADHLGHVTVRSYPINAETVLGGSYEGVTFAAIEKRRRGRPYAVDIGFERIGDAEAKRVYELIVGLIREARDRAAADRQSRIIA